jgi:hypothetical protein
MAEKTAQPAAAFDPNRHFYEKAERALRELFEKAKADHEVHFALALMPEMRGMQDAGWNTAEEAVRAYDDFTKHIKSLSNDATVRIRIILAFYMHLAEGAGFYEIPKKMLLTTEGKGNNILPFQRLVKKNRKTGQAIAPNANAIMKDLMGHAWLLGFYELSEVFKDAFDIDVGNSIAHADYILANDGMRLRRRNGGQVRVIPWIEFDALIGRGLNLFSIIRELAVEYVHSYDPPRTVTSRMTNNEPLTDYTIYYDPEKQVFGFKTETITSEKPVHSA